MSQYQESIPVEVVRETPASAEAVPIGEIIAGLAALAAGAVMLGVKGGVALTKLGIRGSRAAARGIQAARARAEERRLAALDPALAGRIAAARSAREVLDALSSSRAFVPQRETLGPVCARLDLALRRDAAGGEALAAARALGGAVLAGHAAAMSESAFAASVRAARRLGFQIAEARPERGYLRAEKPSGETLRVDVRALSQTGGAEYDIDSDGYEGGACEPAHRAFRAELETELTLGAPKRRRWKENAARTGVNAAAAIIRR